MCVHRTYRSLAEQLAARGVPALRFDYHGTGDSSGNLDDSGRVEAWKASISAAVEELRERSGVQSVVLFGVRFGATLAAIVAESRPDVAGLVLWAPNVSGRAFVRELRAFSMIKDSRLPSKPMQQGGEEAAGYLFGRATLSDLASIDLLALERRVPPRALIIGRDDLPGAESRLARYLEGRGARVDLIADSGYGRMMRAPQESTVPHKTIDAILTWVQQQEDAPDPPDVPLPPKSTRSTLVTTSRPAGKPVRELPLRFGNGQRLFGIATQPLDRPVTAGRPAILFLNVGANHRVGPNRMYVSMARDLASLGYLTFRFDVGGLGDSSVPPGAPENRLYSKDSVGDVKSAMSSLADRFGVTRFVLVGLCSGAYLAFHTCIEDPRVTGQILLNPQTFEWREGDSLELSVRKSFLSTRYYARALLNAQVWRKAMRGNVDVIGVAGILRQRLKAHLIARIDHTVARVRGRHQPQSEVERALHGMCSRGVDTLLVFSFDDGGLDMIEQHLGSNARKMRHHGNFRFEIVDGADHTFTPVDSQNTLHGLIRGHVTSRFP
jgi:pimeloyl-ACP methyl ester carboxylesterase